MSTSQDIPVPMREMLQSAWPLVLGFTALAIPAAIALSEHTWSSEAGAHGPLVLCTAAWLLWRQSGEIRAQGVAGRGWIVAAATVFSLLLFIIGEAFDVITLEAAGLYAMGVTIFYSCFGWAQIVRNWFIFLYLLFAVPPPRSWLDALTFPLKQFVSSAATAVLRPFGIPATHEGVTIYVAQYQYLVEDACSGLNSLVGLLAISLFYIYLARGSSWRYSLFLAMLAVPIAILANVLRIIILILLTEFFGDAVAQGFMHSLAGIFVFAVALGLVFAIDSAITAASSHWRRA